MTVISAAIGSERRSRILGYAIGKGNFVEISPNLPMRIAVLAEADAANQASFSEGLSYEMTTAKQAGDKFGYGSPIHQIMRILKPAFSAGVGGIPVVVYPQAEVDDDTQTYSITVAGTATANATHRLRINGRYSLDGVFYEFAVATGDTAAEIATKIKDLILSVLSCPFTASIPVPVPGTVVNATAKWKGLTGAELNIEVDNQEVDAGMTYTVAVVTAGLGTPSISTALANFGNEWNTIVINSYGSEKFAELEEFNGIPDPENATGRYQGLIMKPFVALFGSTLSNMDSIIVITDASERKTQVTNAICPAPNSDGTSWEAAANMTVLLARVSQDSPHLDVTGKSYPDMPTPKDGDIEDMSDYVNRDALVKKGSSTVTLENGKYVVQDFVTMYHPDGENPPFYNYVRLLMIHFNYKYGYRLRELMYVIDHAIAESGQPTRVEKVVKPAQWIQEISDYIDDLAQRALIVDTDFSKSSIAVSTDLENPDRLNTNFSLKTSPFMRIHSTTVKVGFAFGIE